MHFSFFMFKVGGQYFEEVINTLCTTPVVAQSKKLMKSILFSLNISAGLLLVYHSTAEFRYSYFLDVMGIPDLNTL